MWFSLVWFLAASPVLAGPAELGEATGDERDAWAPADVQAPSGPQGIINGEDATEDDWPMTGGVILGGYIDTPFGSGDFRSFMCSSTLIAPDVVLLAAHCIDETAVHFGYGELHDADLRFSRQADLTAHDGSSIAPWPSDAAKAWDWVMHPEWDFWSLDIGLSLNYDIGLVFLEEPILDVPFAYLPTADEGTQVKVGMDVKVVGWGMQQAPASQWESPPPGTFGIKQMGWSHINEVAPYEFQVGAVVTDVRKCHGDSGGPSFAHVETDSSESIRLVGVTSHAYDESNCDSKGGVDTRVDFYLEWIDAEMRARCADGSRSWCEEEGIPAPPAGSGGGDELDDEGERRGLLGACGCAVGPAGGLGGLLPLVIAGAGVFWRRRR